MGATSWDGSPSPSPEEIMGKFMVAVTIIILLMILYFLMAHLFARWVVGGFEDQSLARSRRRLDFAPTQDPELAHSGLEASVIHALPVVIFKQVDFQEGLECAVCLSELEDGETARLLPSCNHGFHVECIDMWFYSHSTCPLCRITVEPDCGESSPETRSEEVDSDSDSPVSAASNSPDVQATSSCPQSPCSSTYSTPNSSRQSSLIIEIPTKLTNVSTEEEMESPVDRMPARFRSLTGLLSRGKTEIAFASSPNSVDVEQGEGKGQS